METWPLNYGLSRDATEVRVAHVVPLHGQCPLVRFNQLGQDVSRSGAACTGLCELASQLAEISPLQKPILGVPQELGHLLRNVRNRSQC